MKSGIKYIFFDVANTLFHKPKLFTNIHAVLEKNNYNVEFNTLKYHHKILSESIKFPDKTSSEFYSGFNSELLLSLGILPTPILLDEIFSACTYLPWEPFSDTVVLNQLQQPVGIISNWDKSLQEKLSALLDFTFFKVIGSEMEGIAKPDIRLFEKAIASTNVKPEEIIYIGDSLKLDIAPAMVAGINAFLIDREGIYKGFPKRLNSLSELTNILKEYAK